MVLSQRLSTAISHATKSTANPYICASCRSRTQLSSRSSAISQQVRHNSELPFTEKLRRKIWGTDNPPGLKDPYGGPSFLERRLAERRERAEAEAAGQSVPGRDSRPVVEVVEEEPSQAPERSYATEPGSTDLVSSGRAESALASSNAAQEPPADYREANTWHGLEWVGHRGDYRHMEQKETDEYEPWLRVTDEKFSELQLWQMLHESVFDAVQPAEEPYDENLHFSVSQDGKITPDISDASDGLACRSFENATIDFTTPATFKTLKNFQRLCFKRLPDPFLNALAHQRPAPTWGTFITAVVERQSTVQDPKVFDYLSASDELAALPNVEFSAFKEQPWQKEQKLGRLKVIEAELEKRGLPPLSPKSFRSAQMDERADYDMKQEQENEKEASEHRRQQRLARESLAQFSLKQKPPKKRTREERLAQASVAPQPTIHGYKLPELSVIDMDEFEEIPEGVSPEELVAEEVKAQR